MPTETFFNLSEMKRQKIINAARKEFNENELHKSRVSNIIKDADIPRGSFYQYFEDIEDLYFYVADVVYEKIFDAGKKCAKLTDDIFEFTMETFKVDYEGHFHNKNHKFITNMMRSVGFNEEFMAKTNEKRHEYIDEILSEMDINNIRYKNKDDLHKMYEMLQHIKRFILHKSRVFTWDLEKALMELSWYLEMFKSGLLLKEE
jgi:AcrR family transcriptional regulator